MVNDHAVVHVLQTVTSAVKIYFCHRLSQLILRLWPGTGLVCNVPRAFLIPSQHLRTAKSGILFSDTFSSSLLREALNKYKSRAHTSYDELL